MANTEMRRHPAFGIPGALRHAFLAVYPVVQPVQTHAPVQIKTNVMALIAVSNHLKSDSTRKRLSTWQTNPTAFAARQHREEP